MTTSNIDYAVALAESGFSIFPLRPGGKEPALKADWRALASADPKTVAGFWSGTPDASNRNIGLKTGTPYGSGFLVVIDVDVAGGKTGLESFEALQQEYGRLPPTFTIQTASGGRHLYFISPHPLKNSCSKIAPYVNVKGENGYVAGPGSAVNGKPYTLVEPLPVADLPSAYVELCGAPRDHSGVGNASLVETDTVSAIARAISWLEDTAPEAIEGAGGDNTTIQVANRVGDFGIAVDTAATLMLDHWNETKASPPWDPDELAQKVRNAFKSRQNAIGIASAEAEFEPVEIDDKPKNNSRQPAALWEHESEPTDDLSGIVPDYVNRFARDRANRLGVSIGAVTAATVTTLSALVPASNNLHLRQYSDSCSVKSIIWTAMIGDPGTAKSPAVNAAMAFPEALEKSWRADFAKSLREFEGSQIAESSKAKKRSKPGPLQPKELKPNTVIFPDDNEGTSTPLTSEAAPKLRRKIVNDATTEALGLVLHDGPNEAPVLVHSDELVGLIGGMDAYRSRGSKDKPIFLQAKEGKSYAIDRKSSGTLIVPSLAISILGTIQDEKLSKIAPTLTDDGFLQRFALVIIRKTGRGADIPDDLPLNRSISTVAHALADLEPQDHRLSPEADLELGAVQDFSEREKLEPGISTGLRTWLSKTPSEFGRYCLAFHLIEWASGIGPALGTPPATLVSRATASRARRYVEEFLYGHAQYVYGTVMAMGQDDGDVKWVAEYILCRELKTINAREIGRAYRSLRGAQKRSKLFSVMATLAQQDWVKMTDQSRGEWKVNPAVHDGRFKAIKDAETKRRTAVRSEIAMEADRRRSKREMRP